VVSHDFPGPGPVVADAFGTALLDQLDGKGGTVIYERDDGYVAVDPSNYFEDWSDRDTWAVDRLKGRVLDIGAGAGRVTSVVVERGLEAVALDVSAGAVEVCRRRGIKEVFHGTVDEVPGTELFDSFLVLGNNLGLIGSPEGAKHFFATLARLARPGAVLVGGCLDPYQTDDYNHLAYHELNRERGRAPGQVTLRTRYGRLVSEWFDLWWMAVDELAELSESCGWRIVETLPGTMYAVVLEPA
jgi:SAM-dependent methyltransferase